MLQEVINYIRHQTHTTSTLKNGQYSACAINHQDDQILASYTLETLFTNC